MSACVPSIVKKKKTSVFYQKRQVVHSTKKSRKLENPKKQQKIGNAQKNTGGR